MARARPFLLTSDQYKDLIRQAAALERAIQRADEAALQLRWEKGVGTGKRAPAGMTQAALQRTEAALQQSRQTLERARMLLWRVETVGFQLRRQGDQVVASVSEELRRNNKGVASPAEVLSKLQGVTGRFQAFKQLDEQTQKLKKQLEQAEHDIRKLKHAEPAPKAAAVEVAPAERRLLATRAAGLYAQRRKVNQYLVNHNDLANRVKNIPVPGRRPAGDGAAAVGRRSIAPGSYRFVISGARGVPLVSVDGDAGTPPEGRRTLAAAIEGGSVTIDLLVAANAPAGALRLLVHDPVSRATEDVVLTVLPARKP